MTDLDGRVAVITGAGGGIGRATALSFTRAGARLCLFDRDGASLEQTADECRSAGAEVATAVVDQTDQGAVEAGVRIAESKYEKIDVLFANAGYGKFAPFLDQSEKEWRRHVDVNLTGTFFICQAVARSMVSKRQGGAIIVNASSGATQYTDLLSAYCSTKAALGMLVLGMASELGAHRIRVNAVLPGVIETPMTAPMLSSGTGQTAAILAATPLGRLGRPEDIAAAVLYLASEQASYVTGHSIAIDGGQTIHGYPQWYVTDYGAPNNSTWTPQP
jgi:NAD(P)-dependent dehydrogenase (short-subunit alcohol dehydrogenase family)